MGPGTFGGPPAISVLARAMDVGIATTLDANIRVERSS
jgi:hypothetical protein